MYVSFLFFRTYAKQTLALLCSPRRANALSSAPRLATAILRKSYYLNNLCLTLLRYRIY